MGRLMADPAHHARCARPTGRAASSATRCGRSASASIGKATERPDDPIVRGLVASVAHLVEVDDG